ncbi:hypothetical protein BDR26DRAFT_874474 [Obelidium mucronatum]|nr:hypothetical protein BDR26DRAFT_874474 [Obelidium mucronatum]
MQSWIEGAAKWRTLKLPMKLCRTEEARAVPISRSLLLVTRTSQYLRTNSVEAPPLPTPSDFWIFKSKLVGGSGGASDASSNVLQLDLSSVNLTPTDGLQIIHFNRKSRILTVVLGSNNSVVESLLSSFGRLPAAVPSRVFQYKLVVPDQDSLDGIHFQLISSAEPKFITYRAPMSTQELTYPKSNLDFEAAIKEIEALPVTDEGENYNVGDFALLEDRRTYTNGRIHVIDTSDDEKRRNYRFTDPNDVDTGDLSINHHMNAAVQGFLGDHILLPVGGTADGFWFPIELYNWRTGESVHTVYSPKEMDEWVPNDWDRGLLPNSSTFYLLAHDEVRFYDAWGSSS